MTTVFISYVSENYPAAAQVAAVLSDNGFDVWLDRRQLQAGQTWLNEIRKAIRAGSYFIPLFSKEWNERARSVPNDELLLAIEELRKRPYEQQWLIPLRINNCSIPDIPIDPTRTLLDLHYVDFARVSHTDAFRELLRAMGVDKPNLDKASSGQVGWPFHLRIVRNDKYVGVVPFCYKLNGKSIAVSPDANIELKLATPGDAIVLCECTYVYDDVMQSSPGLLRGCYYRGVSNELSYRFISGHRYELFVSGDDIWKDWKLDFKFELIKGAYRWARGTLVRMDDPTTWPKIRMNLSEL